MAISYPSPCSRCGLSQQNMGRILSQQEHFSGNRMEPALQTDQINTAGHFAAIDYRGMSSGLLETIEQSHDCFAAEIGDRQADTAVLLERIANRCRGIEWIWIILGLPAATRNLYKRDFHCTATAFAGSPASQKPRRYPGCKTICKIKIPAVTHCGLARTECPWRNCMQTFGVTRSLFGLPLHDHLLP